MAIEKLDKLTSGMTKVALGRKYDHSKWILDGFTDLCLRAEMMSEEEANQLSSKDVLRYAWAREKVRAQYPSSYHDISRLRGG